MRPSREGITTQDTACRIYWCSYWNALILKNGVPYKKWEAPNSKENILQLIVPQKRVKQTLEKAYDSPSGGLRGESLGEDSKEVLPRLFANRM